MRLCRAVDERENRGGHCGVRFQEGNSLDALHFFAWRIFKYVDSEKRFAFVLLKNQVPTMAAFPGYAYSKPVSTIRGFPRYKMTAAIQTFGLITSEQSVHR